MTIVELPKFNGDIKESNGLISLDNTIFVLEREYAITHADDERPVLMTAGILGWGETGCTGIIFYDPDVRLGSLAHLYHHNIFSQTIEEVLAHMKKFSGRRFRGYIVRPTENPNIEEQLVESQTRLLKDRTLINPFELFPEQTVVFDTRDGNFSKRSSGLYCPSIEGRPYGNRIIREGNVIYTNPEPMSNCYDPSLTVF